MRLWFSSAHGAIDGWYEDDLRTSMYKLIERQMDRPEFECGSCEESALCQDCQQWYKWEIKTDSMCSSLIRQYRQRYRSDEYENYMTTFRHDESFISNQWDNYQWREL